MQIFHEREHERGRVVKASKGVGSLSRLPPRHFYFSFSVAFPKLVRAGQTTLSARCHVTDGGGECHVTLHVNVT